MKKLIPLMLLLSSCAFIQSHLPGVLPSPTPTMAPTPAPTPIPTAAVLPPPNVGNDELGLRSLRYNMPGLLKAITDVTEPFPTGAIWDNSFGGSDANLVALFNSGKTDRHRAHLLNGTCVTNRVCTQLDLLRGYTWAQISAEAVRPNSRLRTLVCNQARRVRDFIQRYPNIKFFANGLLEHHMTRDAAAAVAGQIAVCAPGVQLVDNPGFGTDYAPIPGVLRERHGTAVADICSLDGSSVEDVDVEKWESDCAGSVMTLVWGRCDNLRTNNSTFIAPDKRTNACTDDQFAWHNQLRFPAEGVPTNPTSAFCRTVSDEIEPELWKTSSEDKGGPDVRKNKPLQISKYRGDFDILAANGTKIGFLRLYGSFGKLSDKLWRAYTGTGSGQSAMQLRAAAIKAAGSEWGYIRDGARKCRRVNFIRRSGYFHD